VPRVHWIDIHPAPGAPALRQALLARGFEILEGPGAGSLLIVADRPDPAHLPHEGLEALWWVREATPEEVSAALAWRPGWVVRQESPLESALAALQRLQHRDLGSEGWLRQMLQQATLDELLRMVLVRAEQLSGARQGAIWVRQDNAFFQRCGEGYPEAPVTLAEAASLVRTGDAWLLCSGSHMGILRLRDPQGDPATWLAWIKEVEHLLQNAWNLERSQALSFKDDLTVAKNRRAMEAELPRAVREAAARGDSLALLFLDVDNLKALNSRFGHPTGSRVLTTVAKEATATIRAQDRLYRYGGDEFCIVMPGTSASGAAKMGERLLQNLREVELFLEGEPVPISLSIGISAYPAHADGAEHLIACADRALLRAKSEGKARVVVAD
jgi:diguanylate cyclase (GGDEF)-like protein